MRCTDKNVCATFAIVSEGVWGTCDPISRRNWPLQLPALVITIEELVRDHLGMGLGQSIDIRPATAYWILGPVVAAD